MPLHSFSGRLLSSRLSNPHTEWTAAALSFRASCADCCEESKRALDDSFRVLSDANKCLARDRSPAG